MPPDLHYRNWHEGPPDYVFSESAVSDLFSVEVCHNGFFCGLGENLSYVSSSSGFIDNCSAVTWSSGIVDEILNILGYHRDGRLHVYWCLPGKDIIDGLVPVDREAHYVEMIKASKVHKTLVLFLDHTNFLRSLRDDVIINGGPPLPPVISPRKVLTPAASVDDETCSFAVVLLRGKRSLEDEFEDIVSQNIQSDTSDSGSDFYDSENNVEEGDDDLFVENVDKSLNDFNEKEICDAHEDESALDDEDLQLGNEDREHLMHKFKAFNPEIDMADPVFKVGMLFSGVEEARKAVAAYSIRNRVLVKKIKNDRRRLVVICEEDCPWMLKAAADSRTGAFVITAYAGEHTCERVWALKALTAKVLQEKFMNEFRDNQKLDLPSFAAKVQREYGMCPDRWKLSRARKGALLQIHGDEEGQFRQLWDYGQELRRSNPGSKFFLSTNSVNPGTAEHKEHLANVYWSYDGCKRGFLAGCRPVICLDGCHIKTRYKGQLLTAVGVDPNDCIYPVAFGLVEVECTDSWEWFLTNLKNDLNISNTSPWTIMSDKQKGLIKAVQKVFPDAEHRFCVRHMLQNFQKAGHRGETLKNDLWAIARSTNIPKWQKCMDKLKVDSEEACAWIEELVPSTWIKAFFSELPKCDILLNNHSEVFNSYILDAREMPFLSMLETIFYKLLQRIQGKQKEAQKWTGKICPKIKKKLEKFTEWSKECMVKPAGNYLYTVSSHEMEQRYTVDFKRRTCDCKRWQLTGIPCHHVIACCRNDRINPESLVHSCYTIETYTKAYDFNLVPLRGRVFWEKMNGVPIHPPLYTKVMGRPKKNRKKAPEEKTKKGVQIFTKAGVTMHCSICGKPNHNKKGHQKFVESQLEQNIEVENEQADIPYILQHVIPHTPDPSLDPTQQVDTMVYRMTQEERDHVPVNPVLVPLPENAFIAAARESIPGPRVRVTTASTRGNLRGRGRGRSTATREPARTQEAGTSRGGKKGKKIAAKNSAAGAQATTAQASTAQVDTSAPAGTEAPNNLGYNTGPGSFYYLLFGNDKQKGSDEIPDLNSGAIPDLNLQEFILSQNAPPPDM